MSAVKEVQFMGVGGREGMHSVLWEEKQEETVSAFISPLLLGSVLSPSLCHLFQKKKGSSGRNRRRPAAAAQDSRHIKGKSAIS